MPAKLSSPSTLVIHKLDAVESVQVTAIHIDTRGPVVFVSMEATVVTDTGDPGDPEADPPVDAREKVTERRAMPNAEYTGEALAALMNDVTARTIEKQNVYAGIKGAVYAQLKTDGILPSNVTIS